MRPRDLKKLKSGTKVKISDDISIDTFYDYYGFVDRMEIFIGKHVTVRDVFEDSFTILEEIGYNFYYTMGMVQWIEQFKYGK